MARTSLIGEMQQPPEKPVQTRLYRPPFSPFPDPDSLLTPSESSNRGEPQSLTSRECFQHLSR
jgi:hypothetical protein